MITINLMIPMVINNMNNIITTQIKTPIIIIEIVQIEIVIIIIEIGIKIEIENIEIVINKHKYLH